MNCIQREKGDKVECSRGGPFCQTCKIEAQMNQLEETISGLFPTTFNQTKPTLADHPCDLDITTLRDDQLFALLAWEFWADGMDWDLGIHEIAMGQSALYPTRERAIHILKTVFDY